MIFLHKSLLSLHKTDLLSGHSKEGTYQSILILRRVGQCPCVWPVLLKKTISVIIASLGEAVEMREILSERGKMTYTISPLNSS